MIRKRSLLVLAVGLAGCTRPEPICAKAVWLPKLWERQVTEFAAVGDRIFATQPWGQAIGSEDGGRTWHAAPGTVGDEFASDGESLFAFIGNVFPPCYRRLSRRTAAGWQEMPFPQEDGHLFGTSRAIGLIGPGWVALWRTGRWEESLSSGQPSRFPPGVAGGPGPPTFTATAGDRAFYLEAPEHRGGAPARPARVTVLVADTSAWTLAPPAPLGDPIVLPAGAARLFGLAATETDVYALVGGRLFRFPLPRGSGPWIEEPAPGPVATVAGFGGAIYRTFRAPARLERRNAAGRWVSWGAVPPGADLRILGATPGRLFVTADGYPLWKPAADPAAPSQAIEWKIHSRRGPLLDGDERLILADPAPRSSVVESLPKDSGGWGQEELRPGARILFLPASGRPIAISGPATSDPSTSDESRGHVWLDGRWHAFSLPGGKWGSAIGVTNREVFWSTVDDLRGSRFLKTYARSLPGGGTWRVARPPLEQRGGAFFPGNTWLVGTRICTGNTYSSVQRETPLWCSDGEGQGWKAIPFPLARDAEGVLVAAGEESFLLDAHQVWRLGERGFEKLGPPIDLAKLGVPLRFPRPLLASDGVHLYVAPGSFDGTIPIRRISLSKPDRWEEIRWQEGVRFRVIDSLSADAKRHALFLSTDGGPLRLEMPAGS